MKNKLVRFMAMALCAATVASASLAGTGITVHAAEKEVQLGTSVTGTLSEDGKTLTISGTGEMTQVVRSDTFGGDSGIEADANTPVFTEEEVKGVETIIIEEGITSICDTAFATNTMNGWQGTENATVIQLPSTLETIGANAFHNTKVENIVIPDSVTTLGSGAFNSSKMVTSLTIGSGIVDIPNIAFQHMLSLEELIIPDTVQTIAANAFSFLNSTGAPIALKKITIGSGVTSIAEQAFVYNAMGSGISCAIEVNSENPVALAYDWEGNGFTFASADSGNTEGVTVTGTVSEITTVDVTVPVGGINFAIDETGAISAQGIVIKSNTITPLTINVLDVEALEAGDTTNGLLATTTKAPTIVKADTFTLDGWNNLTKEQTANNIALSLKQVDVVDDEAATELTELTTDALKVTVPVELADLATNAKLAHLTSGYGEASECGINLELDTAFTNYGKAWGNTSDLTFRYLTTLEFALDN